MVMAQRHEAENTQRSDTAPTDDTVVAPRPPTRREREARSLDIVYRTLASSAVAVVFGTVAVILAAYVVLADEETLARNDAIMLWVMTGVIGLITSVAVLIINRRRPYSPLVLLGLLPMAASAYWLFG
jgi:hypothetical protein